MIQVEVRYSPHGKNYAYNAPDDIEVGDMVVVPTVNGDAYARVVRLTSTYRGRVWQVAKVFQEKIPGRTEDELAEQYAV